MTSKIWQQCKREVKVFKFILIMVTKRQGTLIGVTLSSDFFLINIKIAWSPPGAAVGADLGGSSKMCKLKKLSVFKHIS